MADVKVKHGRKLKDDRIKLFREIHKLVLKKTKFTKIAEILGAAGFTDENGNPCKDTALNMSYNRAKKNPSLWALITAEDSEHSGDVKRQPLEASEHASQAEHAASEQPDEGAEPNQEVSAEHSELAEAATKLSSLAEPIAPPEAAEVAETLPEPTASEGSEPPEQEETEEEKKLKETISTVARKVFAEMMESRENMPDIPNLPQLPYIPNLTGASDDWPPQPTIKGRTEDREYEKFYGTLDITLYDRFTEELQHRRISAGRLLDRILWMYYGKPPLSFELSETELSALMEKLGKRPKKTSVRVHKQGGGNEEE